jgi:hypothetical protein
MEPKNNVPEESLEELSRRFDAEQDIDKLLELAWKIQRLRDAQQSHKNRFSGGGYRMVFL